MTGDDLKHLRLRYGLTLIELSKMLKHHDHMQIWKWEQGLHKMSGRTELRLGQLFARLEVLRPPTERCPLCGGVGLICPQKEGSRGA